MGRERDYKLGLVLEYKRLDATRRGRAQGYEVADEGWLYHGVVCMMVADGCDMDEGIFLYETAGKCIVGRREMRAFF